MRVSTTLLVAALSLLVLAFAAQGRVGLMAVMLSGVLFLLWLVVSSIAKSRTNFLTRFVFTLLMLMALVVVGPVLAAAGP